MTLITILLVFLLGVFFASWGLPFFDSLFTTITGWFQLLQGKLAVKITENQVKVAKMTDNEAQDKTPVIGFTIPQEEEECEDD